MKPQLFLNAAVAVAASAYTLVVIAIERYFAIVQPLRYSTSSLLVSSVSLTIICCARKYDILERRGFPLAPLQVACVADDGARGAYVDRGVGRVIGCNAPDSDCEPSRY